MQNRFTVNFRVADEQRLTKGHVVTYIDEHRLEGIKLYLTLQTDFFVVSNINGKDIEISNGIDNIKSTSEQLIRIVPYLDEIPCIKKPYPSEDPNRYLRDLIKWKAEEELLRSYPIGDNYLSIIACGLILTEQDFYLQPSNYTKSNGKKMIIASLIPDKISLYLEDK